MLKSEPMSTLVSQPEKPEHYTYLKEFRTQQCPLFLQHKCTQHRPYTCFHWHFANQRRRRPLRKRDGSFNYTPDSYCTKYDETSGSCPNGDECSLLHRNSGDTERRYHVRYYKTASCVHETDSKGVCTKNGAHCAFAHGTQDLRSPTYDLREVHAMERGEGPLEGSASHEMSTSMEKERILNDDPKWNDSQYVLANYKTEPCKRPPRLCRQGYACPQFHNSKDRRRNPKLYKYRSTPCPQVKQHDEWGDPAVCDNADDCQYCHTRTEQQFYPEIYKSTKCKDMVQTGYCPRGPFCAFAHVDQEINMTKDAQMESPRTPNSLASYIAPSLQEQSGSINGDNTGHTSAGFSKKSPGRPQQSSNSPGYPDSPSTTASLDAHSSPRTTHPHNKTLSSSFTEASGNPTQNSVPEPIGKGRSQSMVEYQRSNSLQSRLPPNSSSSQYGNSFTGSEYGRIRQHSGEQSIANASSGLLDSGIGGMNSVGFMSANNQPNMSPFASPFFPAGDTVESVIGNAMDDLNLGSEFQQMTFGDEALDDRGDTASVCSSLSAGLASSYMSNSFSLPMSIPDRTQGSAGSLSQSPPSSPLGVGIPPNQNRSNRFSSMGSDLNPLISPRSSSQQSLLAMASSLNGSSSVFSNGLLPSHNGHEVSKLKEELAATKAKLLRYDDVVLQARGACEAWKKEAEEANRKHMVSEEEKVYVIRQRDEAASQVAQLRQQLDYALSNNLPSLNALSQSPLNKASLSQLSFLHTQLCQEADRIQKFMEKRSNGGDECALCHTPVNITTVSRSSVPCSHVLLCENCALHQIHICQVCGVSNANNQFSSTNGDGTGILANKSIVIQSHAMN
ncbi:RING finger protein unkempt-like [Watersipora subatra]|uniref:RING finger protein unkempt-like n=1 Tax=Watersipora subatra TaxID=2589382 RepID=UPI00355B9038